MEDKKKFGFKQSKIDGSELIFGDGLQQQIPEKYSLEESIKKGTVRFLFIFLYLPALYPNISHIAHLN